MKKLQEMINYEHNYLESVGRADEQGVVDALREQGEGTMLRLVVWR